MLRRHPATQLAVQTRYITNQYCVPIAAELTKQGSWNHLCKINPSKSLTLLDPKNRIPALSRRRQRNRKINIPNNKEGFELERRSHLLKSPVRIAVSFDPDCQLPGYSRRSRSRKLHYFFPRSAKENYRPSARFSVQGCQKPCLRSHQASKSNGKLPTNERPIPTSSKRIPLCRETGIH